MAAAKNTARTNTPTEQNTEDNKLVLYRLEKVEEAVGRVEITLAGLNNPTKQDLYDFRDTLLKHFTESHNALQKQIDEKTDDKDNNTAHAAIWERIREIVSLIKWLGAAFGTAIIAIVVYYLTTGRN